MKARAVLRDAGVTTAAVPEARRKRTRDEAAGRRDEWLTEEEEVRFARQARAGNLPARDALAGRNHALVFALARGLVHRLPPGMEAADLIQEGFLGLYRAAQQFDPERGCRFSTYATWAVRRQMLRALHAWRSPMRLPENTQPIWSRLHAAQQRAEREGREPTAAELAAAAGCTLATARRMLAVSAPPLRLDHPGEDEEGTPLPRAELSCPRAPSEAALLARMQVEAAVARLPQRWQGYIRLRFALDGGEPCTVAEAAAALGCHRNTARKIERDALARLEQLLTPQLHRRPQPGRSPK
jgi:RNA polymerase sigma factor (sigma-70 family)